MTVYEYAAVIYRLVFHVDDDFGDAYTRGVLDAISTLEKREQIALECYYRNGYDYARTGAAIGGVQGPTARQTIHKALRKLRHQSRTRYMSVSAITNRQNDLLREANAAVDRLYAEIGKIINGAEPEPRTKAGLESRKTRVGEIGLSPRVRNLLLEVDISTVEALLALDTLDILMRIRGFGDKSRDEVISGMRSHGYSEWADKMANDE